MPRRSKLTIEQIRQASMLEGPHCREQVDHAHCLCIDAERLECPNCKPELRADQIRIAAADELTLDNPALHAFRHDLDERARFVLVDVERVGGQ